MRIFTFFSRFFNLFPFNLFSWGNKHILLQGAAGSGKDTLLHIIQGKGFSQDYNQTWRAWQLKDVKCNKHSWRLINTAGASGAKPQKEQDRNELIKKRQKQTIWLHLFDLQRYEQDKNEILADHREAKGAGVKFLAIGTHLDKVSPKQAEAIRDDLGSSGIVCFVYDMTKNPRDEIINMIESL